MMMPSIFGENLFNDWMDFHFRILTRNCMANVQIV